MVSFTCCIYNSWPAHSPGSTWILNFLSLVDMSCNFLHLGILMLTFAWEILSKSSKKGNLWLYEILLLFSYILVNEFYLLKWLYVFFCGIRISKAIFYYCLMAFVRSLLLLKHCPFMHLYMLHCTRIYELVNYTLYKLN